MAKPILYSQTINPYADKVARALVMKGIDYQLLVSDDPADVKRWSPVINQLPVLEIDGERIHDSQAILQWLDELYPEPPLYSEDPQIAAAQRRLEVWSDSSFVWYWNRWRSARFPRPGDEQPVSSSLLAKLRTRIDHTFGRPTSTINRAQMRELQISQEMSHRLDDLVSFLGRRPFFHADRPSAADLSVYGMLRVMREGPIPGTDRAIAERPALVAYMERMDKVTGPD